MSTDTKAVTTNDNDDNDGASACTHLDNDTFQLRRQLAVLASEILRLQSQNNADPQQPGPLSSTELQRLITLAQDPPPTNTNGNNNSSSFSTPNNNKSNAKSIDQLPTPASASDGRSEATNLLKSRILKMQEDNGIIASGSAAVGGGNLFPSSPAASMGDGGAMNTPTVEDDGRRIADFSGDEESHENYDQLRIKMNEAEAESALLSAELVAARGRHEEEKRKLMRTAKELRRRNEELESQLSLQRVGSGRNVRSASCPKVMEEGEDGNAPGGGFRFGMRTLASRFASPVPGGGGRQQDRNAEAEEMQRTSDEHASCTSTINTNEDFGQIEFSIKGDMETEANSALINPEHEEMLKSIASLEEKLRQSEHRVKVLEQRLQIVKESGDAVIRSLNEELSDVAEDRARSESAMIKELATLDSQRMAEREEYERRIQEWIAHDFNRKLEVEEYERRIESLLGTVKLMDTGEGEGLTVVPSASASWDKEAEQEMLKDLIDYIELLHGNTKPTGSKRPLVASINESFDVEFNANPHVADEMVSYYNSRPELKEFTLKSELPRMDYELLVVNEETGKDLKLVDTDEIRAYFTSLEEKNGMDEEVDIILRAANQSLLADPLAMLTGEGEGKLVHSGSFHSTVIATVCSFKLDLRHEGERRVKVRCELAICVPSGCDGTPVGTPTNTEHVGNEEETPEKKSATLELARADLAIQFSPSPTSTPSGPLIKYTLLDVKPTITDYEDGSDNASAIQAAAAVLARDRHTHIRYSGAEQRPNAKRRFFSRVKAFSSSLKESSMYSTE